MVIAVFFFPLSVSIFSEKKSGGCVLLTGPLPGYVVEITNILFKNE
jgi:hypothetical protein